MKSAPATSDDPAGRLPRAPAKRPPARRLRSVLLFEEAPELLAGVEGDSGLEELRAPVVEIDRGPWRPPTLAGGARGHLGLLVLDGALLRRVTLNGRTGAELLGTGDVLQPWVSQPPFDTLAPECGWEVLAEARLAVLDSRFARGVAAHPEIIAALMQKLTERSRTLAFQHVASHIPGLEERLLALLWALADRFGKVTPDGVLIPIRLTHSTLAELAGASRPSVSMALTRLTRASLLWRDAGSWVLASEEPTATAVA